MIRKGSDDLTGNIFGLLQVIGLDSVRVSSSSSKKRQRFWKCLCMCGKEKIVPTNALKTGNTKSCGCTRKESRSTHKMTESPTYQSWATMIQRCTNPNVEKYREYGGRGITIQSDWLESFEAFYADMGERPNNMTLDRIDPDGNYNRDNCQWATPLWQSHNKRISSSGVGQLPSGRFRARFSFNDKITNLGTYDSFEEASAKYLEAKKKILEQLEKEHTKKPTCHDAKTKQEREDKKNGKN